MLILTRKQSEEIELTVKGEPVGDTETQPDDLVIKIIIWEIRGNQVKIGIVAAPDKVRILRGELVEQQPTGD